MRAGSKSYKVSKKTRAPEIVEQMGAGREHRERRREIWIIGENSIGNRLPKEVPVH